METRFTKTVKGKTMDDIFEKSEVVSVRHFNPLNLEDNSYDGNKKYQYNIVIRHAEETDGKKLFEAEVKKFESKNKK